VAASRLQPCPGTPNCVSSDAADPRHATEPFRLAVPASEAWGAIRTAVAGMSRTRIVQDTGAYLHAECRSALFGFVDDLELERRPPDGLVAVRSAARLGSYDFGVNRRRVETLRATLKRRGVIR